MVDRIGIDPGLEGAIALIRDDMVLAVEDMPVTERNKKRHVSPALLKQVFIDMVKLSYPASADVYLELVSAMPGQGVSGMFRFGRSFGVIEGVLAARDVPITYVTPQAWKRRAGLIGKEKDASRHLALQLFPSAAHHLKRKKDVGRAEAMLIARFGG